MKTNLLKFFIATVFVLCAGNAVSQSRFYHLVGDTVCGRSPIYYYDWWPDQDSIGRAVADSLVGVEISQHGFMRHYTSSPIRIIGIASTLSFVNKENFYHRYEDYDPTYDTTHDYILYDATPTGLVEIARVCWSDDYMTHPKRYMVLPYTIPTNTGNKVCDDPFHDTVITTLREYYFDSAITVVDSFYLGYDLIYRSMNGPDAEQIHMYYTRHNIINDVLYGANHNNTPCYLVPAQLFYFPNTETSMPANWAYLKDYSLVFPIIEIDTTLLMPCETPGTPTVTYRDEERVRVEWVDSYNFEWMVSVTTQGGSPESGRMIPSTQPFIDLYGLDGDSAYSVYVKGHCHGEIWSEWSPSCTIDTLPEQTEGIEMIEGPFFTLNPNPAGTTVTVEAAENAEQVEIVDMEGRVVYTQTLSHSATQPLTLDISHLTKGVYLVRLSTPQGVAARKLVVE